jgi:hypothetical protein
MSGALSLNPKQGWEIKRRQRLGNIGPQCAAISQTTNAASPNGHAVPCLARTHSLNLDSGRLRLAICSATQAHV